MNQEFNFEKLEVYQRSLKLSIDVIKAVRDLNYKYSRIRDQLIGATISIPLNLAEGNGRNTAKEKINFYKIARGSSFECIPLFRICFELQLIKQKEHDLWREEIREICKMIAGLIRYNTPKL